MNFRRMFSFFQLTFILVFAVISAYADGGIREDVSAKYRPRFEKWKAELLSTSFGRTE